MRVPKIPTAGIYRGWNDGSAAYDKQQGCINVIKSLCAANVRVPKTPIAGKRKGIQGTDERPQAMREC